MDSTALSLCKDNHLPIVVFDMNAPGRSPHRAGRAAWHTVHDMPEGADDLGRRI